MQHIIECIRQKIALFPKHFFMKQTNYAIKDSSNMFKHSRHKSSKTLHILLTSLWQIIVWLTLIKSKSEFWKHYHLMVNTLAWSHELSFLWVLLSTLVSIGTLYASLFSLMRFYLTLRFLQVNISINKIKDIFNNGLMECIEGRQQF